MRIRKFLVTEDDMGNRKGIKHRTYAKIRVELLVRCKAQVPDPERKDLLDHLLAQGYDMVIDASRAKFFQIKFVNTTLRKARADVKRLGKILLANPVIEQSEIHKIEVI